MNLACINMNVSLTLSKKKKVKTQCLYKFWIEDDIILMYILVQFFFFFISPIFRLSITKMDKTTRECKRGKDVIM